MSDHVRKFDDWDIQRPAKPVKQSVPVEPVVETSESVVDDVVAQTTAPFVPEPVIEQSAPTNPFESGEVPSGPIDFSQPSTEDAAPVEPNTEGDPTHVAATAPVDFSIPTGESNLAETDTIVSDTTGSSQDIDPDTGLPIPDYMKPFLEGNG